MKQPEWNKTRNIAELVMDHGEDLADLVNKDKAIIEADKELKAALIQLDLSATDDEIWTAYKIVKKAREKLAKLGEGVVGLE